jgi:putative ABC transport system permease protein
VLPSPIAHMVGAGSLQTVRLEIGASVVRTLVGAALGEEEIGELVHSPVALAPFAYAQRLSGMRGRATRIFVRPLPGHKPEVRAALDRLGAAADVNVEPADFDATLFRVASAPNNQSEALFGGISALVGFMFALNAMLITVPARRS